MTILLVRARQGSFDGRGLPRSGLNLAFALQERFAHCGASPPGMGCKLSRKGYNSMTV